MKNVYPSEVRVDQMGPKAFEVSCYAIRESHSTLVGEGFGTSEEEALQDAVDWMNQVGRMSIEFNEIEPEYNPVPMLGRKSLMALVACVAFAAIGCVSLAESPKVPAAQRTEVRLVPAAPEASLSQIRENMKYLSNPGDLELARQFTVLRELGDPCGVPKAMIFANSPGPVLETSEAARYYLDAFTAQQKHQAILNYPVVGVTQDYLLSLIER